MVKENVNELVDKLTLFDDDLMSRVSTIISKQQSLCLESYWEGTLM